MLANVGLLYERQGDVTKACALARGPLQTPPGLAGAPGGAGMGER